MTPSRLLRGLFSARKQLCGFYPEFLWESLFNQHKFRALSTMAKIGSFKYSVEDSEIVKSAQDRRSYRSLELNNGMKVMLVSDPETDKSSAAIDVHVGYMSDPKEIPGLAHFCEHMLFLGTEKYPEENEYQKFLTEHGGSSNAFTSSEHTNFFFDVTPEHLAGTLDRFAQFFLAPLFTADATEREVNAVNSENDKNLQSDPWRLYQLERSTSDPNHDYSKFGTGNKYSLETRTKEMGVDVRDELLKFHSTNYSSNLMALTVIGKESLDTLSEMVIPLFSGVENKNLQVPEWKDHPYGPEQLKINVSVVPVKDIRNLNVHWPIPDLQPYFRSNPGHYLGHLIGHEGPGSLLSELKARGWVNTLVGGQKNGAKGFMLFMVFVDLTEEGSEHVDDIITLIFQYINMLKKEGPQEWVFKECQDLSAMTFRFKDKEKPRSYSTTLAGLLHDYPLKESLSGPYLLHEFSPALINMVLDRLTPDNVRIATVAKRFEGKTDLKEKWYGTDHKMEKIPETTLQQWRECGLHENLKIPPKNEFIPTNFDICPRSETENGPLPEIVKDTCMTRLWFKQDDKFLRPKACMNFEFTSPFAYTDPVQTSMTYLFVELVKDALNEYAYAAELAGLHYGLNSTTYGMFLQVTGYNDKQHVLLKKIVEKVTNFQIDPKRFEILKELYARGLRNFHAEQPHQHAVYYTTVLMSELKWTNEELHDSLEEVTLEKVKSFIPQLLSKLYLEALIYGNSTKQHALEMVNIVEDVLKKTSNTKPLLPSQYKRYREVQLPDGCYYVYSKTNSVHRSSCIEIYYQCGMQDSNSNMLLELFCQVINEPCFTVLRTKEQLGYIVFSGLRRYSGVQGLRVIVQSDREPQYVESRVEAFLQSMESYIDELSTEEFDRHVSALAAKRLEQPKRLSEQNAIFWGEILSQQYNFDRDNIEVVHLKTLKKEDLHAFYKDMIAHDAPQRHKLSVHVMSTAPQDVNHEETAPASENSQDGLLPAVLSLTEPHKIVNEMEFKRDLGLYPLARPYIDIKMAKSKL